MDCFSHGLRRVGAPSENEKTIDRQSIAGLILSQLPAPQLSFRAPGRRPMVPSSDLGICICRELARVFRSPAGAEGRQDSFARHCQRLASLAVCALPPPRIPGNNRSPGSVRGFLAGDVGRLGFKFAIRPEAQRGPAPDRANSSGQGAMCATGSGRTPSGGPGRILNL